MAISFNKPTFDTDPPGPPIDAVETARIRDIFDANLNTVAAGVDNAITALNSAGIGTSSLSALTAVDADDEILVRDKSATYAIKKVTWANVVSEVIADGDTAIKTAVAYSDAVRFTADGGLAVQMVNKTGAPSVKGTVVSVYTATAVDNAFQLAPVDALDPIGVVYEAGVADGAAAWVTVSGKAKVLFKAATTRGQVARTGISADTGEAAGYAMPMAVPSNPNVAVDDHFREMGHILESKDADVLCLVMLHFN